MAETENSNKMPYFIGIISIVIILIGALVWYFTRGQGLLKFILILLLVLFIASIIFLIVYAVFWLFYPHPVDAVHVNKERILKSCKANAPETQKQLFFKGSDEWEYKFIGYITGVCQIARWRDAPKVDDKTGKPLFVEKNGVIVPVVEKVKDVEDCISFRRSLGFFSSLFSKDEIVRVLKNERSSLNSDRVFLKAMSFAPEKFGFYFLPNRWRDEPLRTQVAREVKDVTLQEVLKEEVNIVQDAIAISPRHQKELEKSNMQQIAGATTQGGLSK